MAHQHAYIVWDIYGHNTKCLKDTFYTLLSGTHYHLADVVDKPEHARKRKVLSSAYALKNLERWEHKVADKTERLIKGLTPAAPHLYRKGTRARKPRTSLSTIEHGQTSSGSMPSQTLTSTSVSDFSTLEATMSSQSERTARCTKSTTENVSTPPQERNQGWSGLTSGIHSCRRFPASIEAIPKDVEAQP